MVIEAGGFGAVGDAELLEDVLKMEFDGVLSDREAVGNLGVGQPFGDQGQEFALAFGEGG